VERQRVRTFKHFWTVPPSQQIPLEENFPHGRIVETGGLFMRTEPNVRIPKAMKPTGGGGAQASEQVDVVGALRSQDPPDEAPVRLSRYSGTRGVRSGSTVRTWVSWSDMP